MDGATLARKAVEAILEREAIESKFNTKAEESVSQLIERADPRIDYIDSNYKMNSDVFDYQEVLDTPNFALKRYKNATYKG